MALAQRMIEGGFEASNIHIFEADSKVGGLCHSKTVDGFTYDVSGGHILFSKDKETMDWMKTCAGASSWSAIRHHGFAHRGSRLSCRRLCRSKFQPRPPQPS